MKLQEYIDDFERYEILWREAEERRMERLNRDCGYVPETEDNDED